MAAAVAHGAAVAAEIIRDLGGRDRTGREAAAAAGHRTLRILFAAARTD
ncbi:hypothetical protein Rhsp01_03990 [Rhizobium sp. NBRC 114257]|uniref:Uncharacterized protein n=1 Tax=Rhizobium dioscoreae TaxID=2653122 RepID=A0ABQ0YYV8_9HYPH|nr:hypothetical protein RsS93_09220 [Rhizobium dioscoreae]GLU79223.1 hypothetical protein Rhsp01_03990 [Rhizobium sp. NBRC 114257]